MLRFKYYILFVLFLILKKSIGQSVPSNTETILKIEMNLSAFGVESDDYPSINVFIDFEKDSSICFKSFYNPINKGSVYYLSKVDLKNITELLKISELKKLKHNYKVQVSDQPNSKIIIFTNKTKYTIVDYGLNGNAILIKLYKLVYKL